MVTTPPGEETPKDYETRRIDLDQPEGAGERAASEAEKKPRTRKTAVEAAVESPAVTMPVADKPRPPLPPASPPVLPDVPPKNDKIWVAAIIGVCIVALACICSCTIVAAVFLNNAPW